MPLAEATGATVWVEKQGVQRVPMTVADLWTEVEALDLAVFVPWLLFATFIKFLGIIANIVRWKVLLAGQGLEFGFGWLTASYFVGRFFGIVMPSTLGLDGWRLYDTIRDLAEAGRVHDRARRRAHHGLDRSDRDDPALHAVRRSAGAELRRRPAGDGGAARGRGAASA